MNGRGVTVAYLDTGTSFDNSAFALGNYRQQITQGLAVNANVARNSEGRLYFTDDIRTSQSEHGTWMTYTILKQAPQANVLVGMLQGEGFNGRLEDYYNAVVKISSERPVKIIGTSTAWGNYNDALVPFNSYKKQYDQIKANNALVVSAAGNDWPSTFAYAPLIEYTASINKNEALKYQGQYYGHWINVTGLNQTATDAADDIQHCNISMYYCVAAPQGPALRDEQGEFLRDEAGNIRYGEYYGTSWAAPNVTAIAGLVEQRYPWMSAKNIFEVVLGTADDIGAAGIDEQTGWGAVNRDAAIGGYGQFAWGQSELDIPQEQTAYFDNNIGDDRSVSGAAGGFDKKGRGVLVLNGHNTYRGNSNVHAGTVVVNGSNVNSSFHVYQDANLVVGDVKASVKNLNNAGRVSLAHVNSELDVLGNYHGETGSHMDVYAHLSVADQVQMGSVNIHGNSSGESAVSVRQAGGANGLIANRQAEADGYLLIAVKGDSKAQFKQVGRITAGAYEYQLQRGQTNANNWYLKTEVTKPETPVATNSPLTPEADESLDSQPQTPPLQNNGSLTSKPTESQPAQPEIDQLQDTQPQTPPVQNNGSLGSNSVANEPVLPQTENKPNQPESGLVEAVPNVTDTDTETVTGNLAQSNQPSQPVPSAIVATPVYRPEAATVIGHQVAVHQLFDMHTLGARRQFQQRNVNNLGNQKDVWVAYRRDDEHYDVGGKQVRLDATYDAVQTGVKIIGNDHFQVGVTAAYGQYDSRSRSKITVYESKGKTTAYAAGAYAEYAQQPDSGKGLKVSSQILWNQFDHELNGENAAAVKYAAKGVSVQNKVSYGFEHTNAKGSRFSIQPQVMVDHHNIKANSVTLSDGTEVKTNNKALWRVGAGVKVQADMAVGQNSRIKPYAEVNVYQQNRNLSVEMDHHRVIFDGQRKVVDTQVGVVAQVGAQTEVWAGAGMQWGDSGYRKASGQIGVRYHF
ncbi:autotransporter outer membrane beta-barrel domain-containing protein [Vitreoscilla sp. C1]|uniref:autotransporter outer membrane beta-barrel domain-containing protein n=1 Tax=Vitreoscilla sp. (strain C1) TaxID=96942 RepID=UPI0021503F3E|nr:autotransporter outer membrane beta-barrel domain-containing protein [Vitreoscilla sp. C1]